MWGSEWGIDDYDTATWPAFVDEWTQKRQPCPHTHIGTSLSCTSTHTHMIYAYLMCAQLVPLTP